MKLEMDKIKTSTVDILKLLEGIQFAFDQDKIPDASVSPPLKK